MAVPRNDGRRKMQEVAEIEELYERQTLAPHPAGQHGENGRRTEHNGK